ncbi:unnamed protein product [Ectocarpus sp. 12 AP-2014]
MYYFSFCSPSFWHEKGACTSRKRAAARLVCCIDRSRGLRRRLYANRVAGNPPGVHYLNRRGVALRVKIGNAIGGYYELFFSISSTPRMRRFTQRCERLLQLDRSTTRRVRTRTNTSRERSR